MRIALVTCAEWPQLYDDDQPLLRELRSRDLPTDPVVWDDPAVDWATHDVAVIRSTWDYTFRPEEFLAWADRVGAVTLLHNPAPVVRWNADKSYLRDLESAGVPIVPTAWVDATADLSYLMEHHGWAEVVVKPSISAGARDTMRVDARDVTAGQALLDALVARGTAMVQPYLRDVEAYGERSLLFIAGELTHTVRRRPALAGGSVDEADAAVAAADEIATAEAVLAQVKEPLLYARVDLVRDDAGVARVIEVELIEPQLFLRFSDLAVVRLADAIVASAD